MKVTLAIAMLLAKASAEQMLFLDDSQEEMQVPPQQIGDDALAWKNTSLPLDERATLLVKAMTLTEKAMIISRNTTDTPNVTNWIGGCSAIERLQVPQINYQDGPQGFRDELNHGTTTAWPSVLTFGQSWDTKLIYEWGQKMGSEFKQKGAGVQLGPGLNVMRIGLNGRDFEYVSGEDPMVGAHLSGPLVKGIQSNGILANAKHYVNNNQETDRNGQSANIDERTQVEMYMPPFEAAIQAEVGSAMCSYNKVNWEWSCANNATLNTHLRDNMGFDGFVMSDWGAVHSGAPDYLPNGLDQEQTGGPFFFPVKQVEQDVSDGKLPMVYLDRAVHRIVKQFIKFGLYDKPLPWNFSANVTSEDHLNFAQKGVEQSTILLKNNDALPLGTNNGQTILVIGDAAMYPVVAGGGSGAVHYTDLVPPIWALADELEISRDHFPLHSMIGYGCNNNKTNCIAYVEFIHTAHATMDKEVELDEEQQINLESLQQIGFDNTIVFAGVSSAEGADRDTLHWKVPYLDNKIIEFLSKFRIKGKVIGAITAPGPLILTDFKKISDAIVFNVMPGQKYSEGLMSILFGRVTPSAKLSFTMPNKDNEQKMSKVQYPGVPKSLFDRQRSSTYTEKHHFGYRWYDQNKVQPCFEFGFGLSYTKFEYSQIKISNRTLTFKVKNTGLVTGSEIAQVYLGVPETDNFKEGYRSPKALKSFAKVMDLQPGEEKDVEIELKDRYFSYWCVECQKWTVEPGTYNVMVGASSRDIRMHTTIKI